MRETRTYPSEFRKEAVKLALSSDTPISQIAEELGVKLSTLYYWIRAAMKEKTNTKPMPTAAKQDYRDLESEVKLLKKQLKRAEMERDILKKAAAYFASQDM